MTKITSTLLVVGFALASSSANATLVNGGFETGLTGWSVSNNASTQVVSNHEGVYTAVEGTSFLQLYGNTLANQSNTVSQQFNLNSGDILSGWAAFDWNDYTPWYDHSAVTLYSSSGSLLSTLWSESGSGLPNYANTPWAQWSYTAQTSDSYNLVFSVGNSGDSSYSPYALFDGAQVSSVPEPTSLALLGLGLAGFGFSRRRKQQA